MVLEKLQIAVEQSGSVLSFGAGSPITASFNPSKLVFSKSASWQAQNAAQRDVPELQFTNAEPRTLTIDLIFDTYEAGQDDVRQYTDKLFYLTTVEKHGEKHRPPVCRLSWGAIGIFFQGVLEQLEQQFTMFLSDGTPVRATSRCTFKEWRTNYDDLNKENKQSSDIVKSRVVKRGESLSSIAAEEYGNSALWRPIADENSIDNPLALAPGTVLLVPTLTNRDESGRCQP